MRGQKLMVNRIGVSHCHHKVHSHIWGGENHREPSGDGVLDYRYVASHNLVKVKEMLPSVCKNTYRSFW